MLITTAMEKMIDFYKGNTHDINHFLKVWAFAKTIGEAEGLDKEIQEILELAAVVHDISCPLCREKYGNADGRHQEEESAPLVVAFFFRAACGNAECCAHQLAGRTPSYLYKRGWHGLSDSAGGRFSGECRRRRIFKRGD